MRFITVIQMLLSKQNCMKLMSPDPNTHIAYFGYGSLVNRATHRTDIAHFTRVRLKGWRRHWLPRLNGFGGPAAMLSVKSDIESEIDGLVITDFARNLASVDERERNYNRELLATESLVDPDSLEIAKFDGINYPSASVYVAKSILDFSQNNECNILRSYLDAVMQGYLNKFGHEGVERFVNSTDNFEVGIREDRKNPRYPRAVTTTIKEQNLFDRLVPASILS